MDVGDNQGQELYERALQSEPEDPDLNRLLSQLGHQVISPRAIGNGGMEDQEHLQYAADNLLVMLTSNPQDFVRLHRMWLSQSRQHQGVKIVYRENDPARNMSFREISSAVTRLEQAGVPIASNLHNLNFWRG